jgi:hypothetical protein
VVRQTPDLPRKGRKLSNSSENVSINGRPSGAARNGASSCACDDAWPAMSTLPASAPSTHRIPPEILGIEMS